MSTHVVIMAGGQGTRLYPLSTPEKPKQFLDLADKGRTLIQLTYDRFLKLDPDAHFWVVTAAAYVTIVREQLPDIPEEQILAEPEPRNTAPCIALSCWKIKAHYPDANIVVTPSDAYVSDPNIFAATLRSALSFSESNRAIVTVGIRPTGPNTGYGYIQEGEFVQSEEPQKGCAATEATGASSPIRKVLAFKEKPSLEVAQRYLADGGFLWNAGIFVWNIDTIESELRLHAPQIAGVMDSLSRYFYTPEEASALARLFPACDKISIDYAIMEKSSSVYTIAASWQWSDLGSFAAIEAITGKAIPQSIKDAQDEYQRSKKK